MRLKAIRLAVVAAVVMGRSTVASSEFTHITSPDVGAVLPSTAGNGRDSEQLLALSTTSPHEQAALGNFYHSVMAGHTVEHSAREQPHELIETSSKVWCR